MQDVLENVTVSLVSPDPGAAEFLVAVLVACGLAAIALLALLPKGGPGTWNGGSAKAAPTPVETALVFAAFFAANRTHFAKKML